MCDFAAKVVGEENLWYWRRGVAFRLIAGDGAEIEAWSDWVRRLCTNFNHPCIHPPS